MELIYAGLVGVIFGNLIGQTIAIFLQRKFK